MKKLSLNPDALAVQSFAIGETRAGQGTVHAHGPSLACPTNSPLTCPDTEYPSCGIVCVPTYQTGACVCQ